MAIKGYKMRITKRQLRRIIREEKARLLKEEYYGRGPGEYSPGQSPLTDVAAQIEEIIDKAVGLVDDAYGEVPLTRKNILDFVRKLI